MRLLSRVVLSATGLAILLLLAITGIAAAGIGITLSKGSTTQPIASSESAFLTAVVVESFRDDSGSYLMSGTAQKDGEYFGSIDGTYDPVTRRFEGRYDCFVFAGDASRLSSKTAANGALSGVAGTGNTLSLTFNGTLTVEKYNYERDETGAPLYKSFIEDTQTSSLVRDITFAIEWPGSDTTTSQEDVNSSRFAIVISPDMYLRSGGLNSGFNKGTRLEVVDGKLDALVDYGGFFDVPIKGTFDPSTGQLTASMTIPPQQDPRDGVWTAFEGTLVVDLAKEGTAGFMTISGSMWQWTEDDGRWNEGDDKGPAGDYTHRAHYSVDGKTPDYPAKVHKGDVDSNLRFVGDPPESVYVLRAASGEVSTLKDDPVIYVGDTIIVPPGGSAQFYQGSGGPGEGGDWAASIGLHGGSYLTVTDKAELVTFGEFFYNHSWQESANPKFDDFQLQLAHLKVKLKGTGVVVKDDGQSSTVKVLEGAATCTGLDGARTVELVAGEMVTATSAGFGEVTTFDIATEQARWQAAAEQSADSFPTWALIPFGLAGAAFIGVITVIAVYLVRKSRMRTSAALAAPASVSAAPPVASPAARHCPGCGSIDPLRGAFCQRCGRRLRD